jgi:hypothetical protein
VLLIVLSFGGIIIGTHLGGIEGAAMALAGVALTTPTPLTLLCRKLGQPVGEYWIKNGKILAAIALAVICTQRFVAMAPLAGSYALLPFALHVSFGIVIYIILLAILLPEERREILKLAKLD